MVLALRGSPGLVVARFGVAAEPDDGDDMQCPVQISVPAAVETVSCSLSTACFQRCDAGECGECRLAADTAAVGPADQELGGDYWADTGFGEQGWSGRVLLDECE